jgi:hypothetical protein
MAIGTSNVPGRFFAGHNTMSSSPTPLIAKDTLKVWEIIFPIFTRTPALA